MLTEAATYDELYRNFRWDIPARFNIATACCDRHADGYDGFCVDHARERERDGRWETIPLEEGAADE